MTEDPPNISHCLILPGPSEDNERSGRRHLKMFVNITADHLLAFLSVVLTNEVY